MNDYSDWKRLGYHRQPRQALAILLRRAQERRRLRVSLEARGLPIPPELAKRPPGPRRMVRVDPAPCAKGIVNPAPVAETSAERCKRFMGRHYQAVGKPTHTRGGLPIYEERRLRRLLDATDHVAPRYHVQRLEQSNRLRDARAVVKMYVSGAGVMSLGGDLLRRLATDGYGKGLRPLGRAAAGRA